MRRIEKGPEPGCLADLRATPGAAWSSVHGTQRQEIREHAFTEQHGLCAYCMSPLPKPPGYVDMKIEHFETRALMPDRQFDWGNLLGVCPGDVGVQESGGEGGRDRFHCDTFRGHLPKEQQRLDLNPAAFPPDVGTMFSYTYEGEMRAARDLAPPMRGRADLTIERLNLNIARLRRNRRGVIDALRSEFRKKAPKAARVKALLQRSSMPGSDGLLPPYCQAATYYLTKKLRQLGP